MSDLMIPRSLFRNAGALQRTRAILTCSCPNDTFVAAMATNASTEGSSTKPRSLMSMPGPKGWPLVGSFPEYFKKENQGQMHELMRRRHREHGMIFREKFGPRHNVAVADPGLMKEILANEGKYPSRPPYESWVLYNKLRKRSGGLMSSDQEYWRRSRSTLAPKLRPKAVNEYIDHMNQVASDLVQRISYLKDKHKTNHCVPHLLHELNKFTMETILYIMLNKRIGCLDEKVPEPVNEFIQSLAIMFLTGHQLMVYANIHKLLRTKPWRRHVQAWDKIYDFAGKLIIQRIHEVAKELEEPSLPEEDEPVDFLKYVVGTHQLTEQEIIDNVIEVFMGGIDTTANSLAFLFYLLSKHQDVQERLVSEIRDVVGFRLPTGADLPNMPFLKACVKETLRLFPPVPMNARVATEDIIIGGYLVPRDTIIMMNIYSMSRDESIFKSSDDFIPDRWLKQEKTSAPSPPPHFSLIPFGLGPRSCVGRRVAEAQIYLSTIQVLQHYWLKKSDLFDIKLSVRTQMTPGPELPVMFIER